MSSSKTKSSSKSGGLSSCSSWSLFSENTAFEETDMVVERLGNSGNVTRLRPEDLNKFGSCPSRESLKLATCKECKKLLILSSLNQHYELKHSKLLSTIKPTTKKRTTLQVKHSSQSCFSPPQIVVKNEEKLKSFIRVEEIDPSEANIEEAPLSIPHFEKKSKSKVHKLETNKILQDTQLKSNECFSQKNKIHKKNVHRSKEKEFEPDKHCGVWMPDSAKNCTRSLTCKTHPLSLRRQVPGRSKEFDVLLAEHRFRTKLNENNSGQNPNNLSTPNTTKCHSPSSGYERINFPNLSSNNGPSNVPEKSVKENDDSIEGRNIPYIDSIANETLNSCNLPYKQQHPRPIKVNSFGGRLTDCKCSLFTRRMDHFRSATSSMLARYRCNMNNWNNKDMNKEKMSVLASQDPLQNGVMFKQKNSRKNNLKRHLSLNEVQGISNDLTKKRHSAEINIVDPFNDLSSKNKQNVPVTNASSLKSNLLDVSTINDFLSSNTSHLPVVEKNINQSTKLNQNGIALNLSQSLNNLISTTHNPTGSTVKLNVGQSTPAVLSSQQQQHQRAANSTKLISPAPNITITQGMIVSLPNAATVLRTTVARSNTDANNISLSSPNITLKQILNKDQNNMLLTISNSMVSSSTQQSSSQLTTPSLSTLENNKLNSYSINYNTLEHQKCPAPNVTVTASLSLSGVLQGQGLPTAVNEKSQQPYKRLGNVNINNPNDNSRLLQQLIVQQHKLHEDVSHGDQNKSKAALLQPSLRFSVPTQKQSSSAVQQSSKPFQRIQIQQISSGTGGHIASSSVHQNNSHIDTFSQQIKPKLSSLPHNMVTFTNTPNNSLHLVTKANASSPQTQSQHSAPLS